MGSHLYSFDESLDQAKDKAQTKNNLQTELTTSNVQNKIVQIFQKLNDTVTVDVTYENLDKIENIFKKMNFIRFWTANKILATKTVLNFVQYGNKNAVKKFLDLTYRIGLYIPKRQLTKLIKNRLKEFDANPEEPNLFELISNNLVYDPGGWLNDIKNVNKDIEKKVDHEFINQNDINEIDQTKLTLKQKILSNLTKLRKEDAALWKSTNDIHTNRNWLTVFEQGTYKKIINKHVVIFRNKTKEFIVDLFTKLRKTIIPEMIKDNVISICFDWIEKEEFDIKGKIPSPADIVITKTKMPNKWNYNAIWSNVGYYWYIFKGIEITGAKRKIGIWTIDNDLYYDKNRLNLPMNWKIVERTDYLAVLAPDLKINRCYAKRKFASGKILFGKQFEILPAIRPKTNK